MREIQASTITDVVEKLCIEANYHLPEDVKCAITGCRACEDGEIAKGVLDKIVENYEIADAQNVPICQDTGMACVFLEIGQDVHIAGGDLAEAVNEGVRRGYDKGYLRKSVVKDPVRRGNTGDTLASLMAGISAMYSMADFSLRQIIPFHRSRWLTVPDMSIPVPTHPLQVPSSSLHLTYPTLALLVLLSLYQSCQPLSVK